MCYITYYQCVFAFLIIQIETTRGDMEKEKEDRLLFLSDI